MKEINLLKTYEDMISNDHTTQGQLDNSYNAIYMDYFIRPDLRINQRAGHKSNGDFVEGMHIYPDRKCIYELLRNIEYTLKSNKIDFKKSKLGTLLYISELINFYITEYFGNSENISKTDEVFHIANNSSEKMANLSDFKNKNCAVCVERALAAYMVLSVIANDPVLKSVFPFRPYYSVMEYCKNTIESGFESHALCGIVSRDNNREVYLFDPSNCGMIKDSNGNKNYVYGLYELSEEEIERMYNGETIEPTLFRCNHLDGITQISHRGLKRKQSSIQKNENEHIHK